MPLHVASPARTAKSHPRVRRQPSRTSADRPISVALAFDAYGSVHWLDVARGATAAAERLGWHVAACPDGPPPSLARLLATGCDGVIAAVTTAAEARAARGSKTPVVNVSEAVETSLPTVTFDNPAIGLVAAEHLIAQGYAHFAFYGLESVGYSARRRDGFMASLRRHGLGCSVFEVPTGPASQPDSAAAFDRWLVELPPATGILAVSDPRARVLLDACRRLAIDVPSRLGVLGVGDFRDLCDAGAPTLSSIRRNGFAVGEAAVAALAQLLAGRQAASPLFTPPGGVAARESTFFGGSDETVAIRAATLVQDDLADCHDVESLAKRLRVSRRKLERAFQSVFGESPHVHVLRIRTEAAAAARAADPSRPLAAIARATGFTDTRHLRRTLAQFAALRTKEG
jgi:LacI family transcriptional regulator